MAYTDDAVRAKLSALNETQEGIVTVAQWVMFHRRHAERTALIWLQKVKDSNVGKRLNLIYLANEVVQQSKARKKDDFLIAFSPIMPEATFQAYKGAHNDAQNKIKRVVEVWRQRQIFDNFIQEAIEARINDLESQRSSGKKQLFAPKILPSDSKASASADIPAEIQPLLPLHEAVVSASKSVDRAVSLANKSYDQLTDPWATTPPAPVHAARLSALLKHLASAETAVAESVKARSELIAGLEKLLGPNREALKQGEKVHAELAGRKKQIEEKRQNVEDTILAGLSTNETDDDVDNARPSGELGLGGGSDDGRPEIEALTPPVAESVTPIGSPSTHSTVDHGLVISEQSDQGGHDRAGEMPSVILSDNGMAAQIPARTFSESGMGDEGGSNKRMRARDGLAFHNNTSHYPSGLPGLDQDVDELLRAESGAGNAEVISEL